MGILVQKLRNSARGQLCSFQIPGICTNDPETTVLCHAPSEISGIGSKGHDYHASFGCMDCHAALDHHQLSKEDELYFWLRGIMRTQNYWVQSGLMILPVDPETAKRRPGKKANMPSRKIQSKPFPKKQKVRA